MIALEAIIGGLVALVGLLAAAFGVGHQRGKVLAEQRAVAENANKSLAEASKRLETMKNAENARQGVDALSDSDVDQRLRERWSRPGGN
ncbi:hypothetical protein [Mixta calida]|uniref:hypothetical protein n=1 Tax=Mixta calida TaxID=665913 RepID=UPI0034D4694D